MADSRSKTRKAAASKTAASDKTQTPPTQGQGDENTPRSASAPTGDDQATGQGDGSTPPEQGDGGTPEGTEQEQGDGGEQPQSATGRQGDSGPGTGVDAPEDRNAARYPASTLDPNPESAPLDPPEDQAGQTQPETGHAESTTDQTYAESGGRTIAGENHVRLVGEDDDDLGPDDLFDDPDPVKTFVVTKARIFEVFTYPNTSREAKRLLYPEGARVPRFQAERIKRAAEAGV